MFLNICICLVLLRYGMSGYDTEAVRFKHKWKLTLFLLFLSASFASKRQAVVPSPNSLFVTALTLLAVALISFNKKK